MSDWYLKFVDEEQAQEVLYTPVYAPDPLPESYVPVPYNGWFVNVRVVSEDPEPLLPFSIDPQPYPIRIWA